MKKELLTAFLSFALGGFAAEMNIEVKTDRPDARYKCGETIKITAQVLGEDGKPVSDWKVKYVLEKDGESAQRGEYICDAAKPYLLETSLPKPGALRAEFTLLDKNGKKIPVAKRRDQWNCVSGRVGAVAEPEKFAPVIPCPANFMEYWQAQKKQLDAVPLKVLEKKFLKTVYGVDVYDVKISCTGSKPVSGYLGIPRGAKAKSHPALIFFHGAGVTSCGFQQVVTYGKMGYVVLDINAHGILNGQPEEYYRNLYKNDLKDYYSKIYDGRDNHYFRGMIHRLLRALEYLKTLPEWNGKDLVAMGGSQGGYQTLIAAALDPQVTLALAQVPGFCEYGGEFFGDPKRMPRMHVAAAIRKAGKGEAYARKVLEDFAYYDSVNFASFVKCPVYITVGYCDLSCPTTAVYTLYNAIPAGTEKHLKTFPNGIHATSTDFPEAIEQIRKLGTK